MRTTKRRQKSIEWDGLSPEQRNDMKLRRLYVLTPIYPAGRWMLGKARGGR